MWIVLSQLPLLLLASVMCRVIPLLFFVGELTEINTQIQSAIVSRSLYVFSSLRVTYIAGVKELGVNHNTHLLFV